MSETSAQSFVAPQASTTHAGGNISQEEFLRFQAERKSPGVALVLCALWGSFGAHRFYMKRTLSAVTMLVISLVSIPLCLVLVGFAGLAAIWIWAIVDLFVVTGWVREHNARLLAGLAAAQGTALSAFPPPPPRELGTGWRPPPVEAEKEPVLLPQQAGASGGWKPPPVATRPEPVLSPQSAAEVGEWKPPALAGHETAPTKAAAGLPAFSLKPIHGVIALAVVAVCLALANYKSIYDYLFNTRPSEKQVNNHVRGQMARFFGTPDLYPVGDFQTKTRKERRGLVRVEADVKVELLQDLYEGADFQAAADRAGDNAAAFTSAVTQGRTFQEHLVPPSPATARFTLLRVASHKRQAIIFPLTFTGEKRQKDWVLGQAELRPGVTNVTVFDGRPRSTFDGRSPLVVGGQGVVVDGTDEAKRAIETFVAARKAFVKQVAQERERLQVVEAARQLRQEQFDAAMNDATQAEARNDRTNAIAANRRAVLLNPDSIQAKQALQRLETAERQEQVETGIKEGEQAEARKDWDHALDAYQKALSVAPNSRPAREGVDRMKRKTEAARLAALESLAEAAIARNDWVTAQEQYLEIRRLDVARGEKGRKRVEELETDAKCQGLLAEAKQAEARGDWAAARKAYESALLLKPGDAKVTHALPILTTYEKPAGAELRSFQGHEDSVFGVAFDAAGENVVSGGWDKTLRLWDASTATQKHLFTGHGGGITAVSLRQDGRQVLSACADGTLGLWDLQAGRMVKSFGRRGTNGIWSVAFRPNDGAGAVSAGADGAVKLWNLESGAARLFEELNVGERLKWIATRTLQGRDEQSQIAFSHVGSVLCVAFSRDAHYVVSGGSDNQVKVWNADTGRKTQWFKGHTGYVWAVAFSPDGSSVLSGGADKTLKLWDVASGRELRTFSGHSDTVRSVCFSPDGRYALSSGFDKTLRLWEIATAKEVRTFTGHNEAVLCVAFSPDGRCAASASRDKTVRLWKLWDGSKTGTE